MKYTVVLLLIALLLGAGSWGEYVERIDGGGIIGEVKVDSDKIVVQDWDGKTVTFYRDYIRRIRSQETGQFATYESKLGFDLWTDISETRAQDLLASLDLFVTYINKTYGFKKPPTEKVTIRVFSSTRDYENHWSNRFGDTSQAKKELAFNDVNFKDVSSVYAGRDTFTVIAPRFAMIYIMRLYPKTFVPTDPKTLWLFRGWYKLFASCRADTGEIDMVGLDFDEMETLQGTLEKKPFTFDYIFNFKIVKETKLSEFNMMEQMSTAFFHWLTDSKKRALKLSTFFDALENYEDPIDAVLKIDKKLEGMEADIKDFVLKFEATSPWRIYYKAERNFLRKKVKAALPLVEEGLKKFPKFENFRRLRAMMYITEKEGDEAMADIIELEKNPLNAEMCMYFRGLIFLQDDALDKAARVFRDLLAQDPTYYRCCEQLLNIYWEQDENIVTDEEATKMVEILKENEPFSYAFIHEAKVLMKQGRPEDAKIPLQKAKRRDPENKEIDDLDKKRAKMAREKAAGN